MLIGHSEQEVETTGDLPVRFSCHKVENKSDKNLETFHFSEVTRDPVVWGMLIYSL